MTPQEKCLFIRMRKKNHPNIKMIDDALDLSIVKISQFSETKKFGNRLFTENHFPMNSEGSIFLLLNNTYSYKGGNASFFLKGNENSLLFLLMNMYDLKKKKHRRFRINTPHILSMPFYRKTIMGVDFIFRDEEILSKKFFDKEIVERISKFFQEYYSSYVWERKISPIEEEKFLSHLHEEFSISHEMDEYIISQCLSPKELYSFYWETFPEQFSIA